MACSFGRPFYGVPILSPLPWWYLRQYLQHVPVRDNIAVCVEPEHVKTGQHILGCCSLVSQQTCSQTFRTAGQANRAATMTLSLIHISEPTRRTPISYAVFCLKKKKKTLNRQTKTPKRNQHRLKRISSEYKQ